MVEVVEVKDLRSLSPANVCPKLAEHIEILD